MSKYKPKVGKPFDADEEQDRQRLRMEWIVFCAGLLIVAVYGVMMFAGVTVASAHATTSAAILAFGVAAASLGIAGTLSVSFKKAGWLIKGTLGFGMFVLVFGVSVWGCRC